MVLNRKHSPYKCDECGARIEAYEESLDEEVVQDIGIMKPGVVRSGNSDNTILEYLLLLSRQISCVLSSATTGKNAVCNG